MSPAAPSTTVSRALPPRVVVVSRPSERDELLLRHGTLQQARFFLESRGQRLDDVLARHEVLEAALHAVTAAVPARWRRARVTRHELDRFLFEPDDVVVAVGQDGLVANVAKYLRGQPVIGVNPSTALYPGVLVRHPPRGGGRSAGHVRARRAAVRGADHGARAARRRADAGRAQRDLRRASHAPERALSARVRRAARAPFVVGAHRGDGDRRDRLGQEHRARSAPGAGAAGAARAGRWRSSCARRGRA